MKTENMATATVCFVLFVLVNLQIIAAKPFFGLFCELLCVETDDYNDSTTSGSSTTLEDMLDDLITWDPCRDCPVRDPTTTPRPGPPFPFPFPNGTMPNPNQWPNGWGPWGWGPWGPGPWGPGPWGQGPWTATTTAAPSGSSSATTAAPATTTAAAGSTAASGTTAAPGATTAAPGGTTTAAPDTTTAAA